MKKTSRRYFLGSLTLLAIAWPQWLEAAPAFRWRQESIGGIKFGMPVAKVKRILGSPRRQPTYINIQCTDGVSQNWQYPGLELFTLYESPQRQRQGAEVVSVIATSRRYPTSRGIAVGDPIDRAERAYGEKFTNNQLVMSSDGWSLIFTSRRGRIIKIEFRYAIC
jgi:hypothetical protein